MFKVKNNEKKRARISMAIQWTSGTRDTVLELQRRIGISWNFHGIFCIKVSSGWMFLMSPWVGYSWWHWKLWKLENTENEAVVLALRVCVIVVMCVSNSLGKSIWFLVAFYVVSVVPVTSAGVPLKAKFEWLISSKWRWSIRRQFRQRESDWKWFSSKKSEFFWDFLDY